MKKLVISAISILTVSLTYAQTATDFTANDCAGTSHHLFAELDAGKIIVAAFVMPCGSCAAPSLAAYNAVQSYATSNPGTVLFYLVDDAANTSCPTLSAWGTTNAMPLATSFSTSSFVMSQYGTAGMPKIIVMGGTDHAVTYNLNSGVTTLGVQAAVDALLLNAGISENAESNAFNLKVTPNPVVKDFQLSYSLDKLSSVKAEIFSATGQLVYNTEELNQTTGDHKMNIGENVKLEKGVYILKITTDSKTETINFVVE